MWKSLSKRWKTFSTFTCALVNFDDGDPKLSQDCLQELNPEMRILVRIAIAIHDEKRVKIELVACIIFQENGQNWQLEFCGIKGCKQWKKYKARGIQNSKVEKEEELKEKK